MKKILVFLVIAVVLAGAAWHLGYLDSFVGGGAVAVVDQGYVKANVGKPGKVLVDVRTADIFNGKPPREGIPGGHIPGAVNFALADLDKPGADKALAAAGITKDVEVIVYCNTGKQSGKFAEALTKKFGYKVGSVKNYAGSMTDWSKDPKNPLEPAK